MSAKRVISAAVLIPAVILFIFFAQPILWLGLVLVIGGLALIEYNNLATVKSSDADIIFSHILNAICIIGAFFLESIAFSGFLAFFLLTMYHVVKREEHGDIVKYFLRDMLGVIYCALLPSYFMLIRVMDGRAYIFMLLLMIWAVDTAAYYVGSAIGHNKLIPNISPNKTVEGAIGGTFGAIIIAVAGKIFFFKNFSLTEALMLGLLISVAAQFGDLFESLLKRAAAVKDSGDLIPGHGGILDRIDSLLFAAPAFYYFTLFLNI